MVGLNHHKVIFHILNICKKMSLLFEKKIYCLFGFIKNVHFQSYIFSFRYYSLYPLSSFDSHCMQNVTSISNKSFAQGIEIE